MNSVHDRAHFEESYRGEAPWDIGRPQRPFTSIADRVSSPILDVGCGTGDTSLFFAARGCHVTGIDFTKEAIRRARAKAAEQKLDVEFLVKDALTLADWDARFSTVLDSGLFHVLSDEDRQRYVRGLANVIDAGGQLFLMCFSNEEPGTEGPRRVSRQELHDAFKSGWNIESIEAVRVEVNPMFTEANFSESGPKAWFAIIRRQQ
jgi:cyclopropane fatty-acyl-phospholipid synthase-like methyltransferase